MEAYSDTNANSPITGVSYSRYDFTIDSSLNLPEIEFTPIRIHNADTASNFGVMSVQSKLVATGGTNFNGQVAPGIYEVFLEAVDACSGESTQEPITIRIGCVGYGGSCVTLVTDATAVNHDFSEGF